MIPFKSGIHKYPGAGILCHLVLDGMGSRSVQLMAHLNVPLILPVAARRRPAKSLPPHRSRGMYTEKGRGRG